MRSSLIAAVRAGVGQRGIDVCLNSLRIGHSIWSSTRSIVSTATLASSPGSSSRRTNTAASSTMNVGTPQTVCDSTYAVCSFSTVASGRPLSTSAQSRVDVGAGRGEHRRQVVACR